MDVRALLWPSPMSDGERWLWSVSVDDWPWGFSVFPGTFLEASAELIESIEAWTVATIGEQLTTRRAV